MHRVKLQHARKVTFDFEVCTLYITVKKCLCVGMYMYMYSSIMSLQPPM